jgi:hypothetical protein
LKGNSFVSFGGWIGGLLIILLFDVVRPQAQKLATDGGGGDWDRRNRLKVYRALSKLLQRDIKGAASLLIDCLATFSCNEICTYKSFIVYTILTNVLDLTRPQLKEKILDGPEILSVASDIPIVVSSEIRERKRRKTSIFLFFDSLFVCSRRWFMFVLLLLSHLS